MAYDEEFADRIRAQVEDQPGLTEKKMFGGLAFLINGHLAVSASGRGGLLLRVEPDQTDALVRTPDAQRFVMRGREMDGWLHVTADTTTPDATLARWVKLGVDYAQSLPPR
jgi:hypothetical protein